MDKNICLLIIDAQYGFLEGGDLPVMGAKENMDRLAQYIQENTFKYIALTLDYHPHNHFSFVENKGSWPRHCVQHTIGAAVYQPILESIWKSKQKCEYFLKGQNPNIEEYSFIQNVYNRADFKANIDYAYKIDEIQICGIMSRVCVLNTVKDLVENGYKDKIVVKLDFIGHDDGNKELIEYCQKNNIRVE